MFGAMTFEIHMLGVMTLGIHMLVVLTFGIKMFGKVRSEFQRLEG